MAFRCFSLILAFCSLTAAALHAQETRTEVLQQQRAEKAQRLEPYTPNKLEQGLMYLEDGGLSRLFAEPDGLHARLGGLVTGSGPAAGPGYRRRVLDQDVVFGVSAAYSTKHYRGIDAEVLAPSLADRRLSLGAHLRYRDSPRENFFGIGNDTPLEARTTYAIESTGLEARGAYQPVSWLTLGAGLGRIDVTIGPGADRRFASVADRFDDTSTPGLAQQPAFLHGDVFVEIDYRDAPGNPREGGRYRIARTRYADRELDRHSFTATHIALAQLVPFLEKKRVIAVSGDLILTDPAPGHIVPFYLQPTLGGAHTLRGFRNWRFRDANLLLLRLEYRWEAFAGLDMGLFVDAGKVAADRRDLGLSDLNVSPGLGFRFNTSNRLFLRIDIARSTEGYRYFLKFGPAF